MNQAKGSASLGGMQSVGRKVIYRHSHAANENKTHDKFPILGNLPRPDLWNNNIIIVVSFTIINGSSVIHPISQSSVTKRTLALSALLSLPFGFR